MDENTQPAESAPKPELTLTAGEQTMLDAYKAGKDIPAPSSSESAAPLESSVSNASAAGSTATEPPIEGESADPDAYVKADDGRTRDRKSGRFVRTVPAEALHREGERRQQTEAERDSLREHAARSDERARMFAEMMGADGNRRQTAAPKPDPDKPIDPQEDIIGAFEQQQERIDELKHQIAERERVVAQRNAYVSLLSAYRADAVQFANENTSFGDAYNFLNDSRRSELAVMGLTDPAQQNKIIAREEHAFLRQAIERKVRPSHLLFEYAKAKGFRPQSATPPSGGNRQPPGAPPDIVRLLNMSDSEFAAAWKSMPPHEQARLKGKPL